MFQSVNKLLNPGEDQTGVVIMPFRNFSAGVIFFKKNKMSNGSACLKC